MTLVPIIYTSLLIFSAILLFVIIVSYVSFKAKGGARKSFELKNRATLSTAQMKPAYVSSPTTLTGSYRETPVVHQRTTQIQYAKNINKPVSTPVKIQQETNNNEYRYSARNSSQKATRLTREERISIVNAPANYTQQSIQNNIQHRSASHRLPDLNMLNYYSDRTGSEFITLSA